MSRFGWRALGWGVFAALLIGIGVYSLAACGVAKLLGLNYCVEPVVAQDDGLDEVLAKRNVLDQQIAQIKSRLAAAPVCVKPPEPEPEPEPEEFKPTECRPVPPSDKVTIIVDQSTSMGDRYPPGGTSRLNFAKRTLDRLVQKLDQSVGVDLFTFSSRGGGFGRVCRPNLTRRGAFSPSQRSALRSRIKGIRLNGGTALAGAISQIPSQVQGGRTKDDPANIVIVLDGENDASCPGGSVCAAARRVKRQMPYATISVISLAQTSRSNRCIATETGGKYYGPQNADKIIESLRKATGQVKADECPKPEGAQ